MAIIHRQIGSLIKLLDIFHAQNINDFHSLKEIQLFQNNFQNTINLIIEKNKNGLLLNINNLEFEIKRLSDELAQQLLIRNQFLQNEKVNLDLQINNINGKKESFLAIISWFKKRQLQKRKFILENHFEEEEKKPLKMLITKIDTLNEQYEDKKNNNDKWINNLSKDEINKVTLIQSIIEANKNFLYGAIGENRALNELSKLPNSYVVINNYQQHFPQPIYDKKNNDRIYSVQIDHIVIGPTGLFLIETKNWSQDSTENQDFFSPVKQLRRSNFAMFVLLNQALEKGALSGFMKKWGVEKISPKNIILLMGHKPHEEFQYVKVLLLTEVRNYITYGNTVFTDEHVKSLENFLDLKLN